MASNDVTSANSSYSASAETNAKALNKGFELHEFAANRLFQRAAGSGSVVIAFRGSYGAAVAGRVEIQVTNPADGSIAVDWIAGAGEDAVSGSDWTSLITVPAGGPYNWKARRVVDRSVVALSVQVFSVGGILVFDGQSNGNYLFDRQNSPPAFAAGNVIFNGVMWSNASAGNGITRLLNNLSVATGMPWAAIDGCHGGVPLDTLLPHDASGFYEALAAQIAAAGGDFEVIFFDQGEGGPYTSDDYAAKQLRLHDALVELTSRKKSQCPFFLCTLATGGPRVVQDSLQWEGVNTALLHCATVNPYTYFSHSYIDADRADDYHYDAESYERGADRYALAYTTWAGLTTGVPHFFIDGAVSMSATVTRVALALAPTASDFTPTEGIAGFEISGDGGITWNAAPGVRNDATNLDLITEMKLPSDDRRALRYVWGLQSALDLNRIVRDNSALQVPLTPSYGMIKVRPL